MMIINTLYEVALSFKFALCLLYISVHVASWVDFPKCVESFCLLKRGFKEETK